MTLEDTIRLAVLVALSAPVVVLALMTAAAFARRSVSERIVGNLTIFAMSVSLAGLAVGAANYGARADGALRLTILPVGGEGVFALELLVDGHGLWFALLASFVGVIVATFAHRYLHREGGYYRYFVQFNLFVLGILLVGLAGSTTLLFAGWEFIGISSAMLVAFFHDRAAPVANALRVVVVYRVSDAAMLAAIIISRHELGSVRLDELFSGDGPSGLGAGASTAIALLLVLAAAGKCAQLPFSGWIPRAMEGPTPSSAVYYGALSIHAGAFLLIRAGPLIETVPAAQLALILMGVCTAAFATLVARVQTDVKSMLAFASLTQVSIILVEIGLGLYEVALVHMTGHALYRLLQFLRAPSVLHEFHESTSAAGGHLRRPRSAHVERAIPPAWRTAVYRFALGRGSLDELLDRAVVRPVLGLARAFDVIERRWCAFCGGLPSVERHGDAVGADRDD